MVSPKACCTKTGRPPSAGHAVPHSAIIIETGSEWQQGTTISASNTSAGGAVPRSSSLPYMPPHTQKKPMTTMPKRPTRRVGGPSPICRGTAQSTRDSTEHEDSKSTTSHPGATPGKEFAPRGGSSRTFHPYCKAAPSLLSAGAGARRFI
jgi:hypothetical protein